MRGPSFGLLVLLALCVVVAGCSESPTPMPPDPDPPDPVSTDCNVGQTVAAGESCTLGRRRALRGRPRGTRLPRWKARATWFRPSARARGTGLRAERSPGSSTSGNRDRNRNRADPAGALGADRILLEDVLRALADIIDVLLMAVATVTGTGLPDGVPFDPDRFRDEARILDWEAGIAILPAGQAAADEFARVIACRKRSG